MAKIYLIQKILALTLSVVVNFLTWFIRLITFLGDVTIWIVKNLLLTAAGILRKANIDLRKKLPYLASQMDKIIRHPLLVNDRSFKVRLATIAFVIFGIWFLTRDLPSPRALDNRQIPQTTKIYDRNGKLLFNIYTDQNRTVVPLSDIPDNLKQATIAVEDKDFYKHKGFDIYGIVRAAKVNVLGGSLQGGSTITQQLVKSAFLTPERTVTRKVKELYLAFRVEMAFSKDRILEMYLNQVPYGGTAWGVSAAAEQYFGKNIGDLTLGEAALLAGLPAAPSYYSPFGQDPQRAKERQKLVLNRMVEEGFISRGDAEHAKAEEIKFKTSSVDIRAQHFVMYVREYLAQKYGESIAAQGGLKVTTTLDLDI